MAYWENDKMELISKWFRKYVLKKRNKFTLELYTQDSFYMIRIGKQNEGGFIYSNNRMLIHGLLDDSIYSCVLMRLEKWN